MYVFVAFVTYTIHIQFPALAMIYSLVIFMTVIYGEWRITTITASAALVSKVLSDLFIVWAPIFKGKAVRRQFGSGFFCLPSGAGGGLRGQPDGHQL